MKKKLDKQKLKELEALLKDSAKKSVRVEQAEVPHMKVTEIKDVAPIRRAKVRELKNAGFTAEDISNILSKGVKDSEGNIIRLDTNLKQIKEDIGYIEQEYLAVDENILLRRGEIIDKLNYIYNRAFVEYTGTSAGASKNQFLNTALSAVRELKAVYGLNVEGLVESIPGIQQSGQKAEEFSKDLQQLSDKERNAIVSTLSKVLEDGD